MNQIDNYIENWSRPGHNEEGQKTLYFGNLLGFLGNSVEGIFYLTKTIEFYKKKIGNSEIPKAVGLNYWNFDKRQLSLWHADTSIKTSEEGINYFKKNGSITNFSIEEIIKKETNNIGSNLLNLGTNIFSPLARAKELEINGVSYEFHPNFIVTISVFKTPNFVDSSAGVSKEFYIKNPLSEELSKKIQNLANQYYSEEMRYGNKNFNVSKRIEFEKGWSAISIEIYKHYIENYLKNTK